MKNNIIWQKHLEACRKYRENNRDRVRKSALDYAKKRKESNPEEYLQLMRDRAKEYRLKDLEKARKKDRESSRTYRGQNREKINAWQREYRLKNKEKFQMYSLKRKPKQQIYSRLKLLSKYGLTQEAYNQILLKQEGKCAICKTPFIDINPNIDHCHTTGLVRGLLCSPCNIVLGYVEKSEKRTSNFYQRMTEYLKSRSTKLEM